MFGDGDAQPLGESWLSLMATLETETKDNEFCRNGTHTTAEAFAQVSLRRPTNQPIKPAPTHSPIH